MLTMKVMQGIFTEQQAGVCGMLSGELVVIVCCVHFAGIIAENGFLYAGRLHKAENSDAQAADTHFLLRSHSQHRQ